MHVDSSYGLCLKLLVLTILLSSEKNATDWFGKRNQQLIVVKSRLSYYLATQKERLYQASFCFELVFCYDLIPFAVLTSFDTQVTL